MDTLPHRDALHDNERMAAVLGGRHWLLRVWKRITSLRVTALRSALQLARRAITTVRRFAHSLRRPAVHCIPRTGYFRSVFMAPRV